MIEKQTFVDHTIINADGRVTIWLRKQMMEDGKALSPGELHGSMFHPTTVMSDQISAINANLEQMGWPPIPAADVKRLESQMKVAHTPEVVEAWKKKVDKELAEMAARRKAVEVAGVPPVARK